MSAQELRDWMEFNGREPFPDARADLRTGIMTSVLATVMGGGTKHKPMDFCPFLKDEYEEQQEQARKESVAEAFHREFAKATQHLPVQVVSSKTKKGIRSPRMRLLKPPPGTIH